VCGGLPSSATAHQQKNQPLFQQATTPILAATSQVQAICLLFATSISHNFNNFAQAYPVK